VRHTKIYLNNHQLQYLAIALRISAKVQKETGIKHRRQARYTCGNNEIISTTAT